MGLRMKCFNIMGLHWKIQFLGGWGGGVGSRNSVCWGRLLKKGAWTVYRFKGCLTKNKGIVFLRGGVICVWAEHGEMRIRKNSQFGHFSGSFSVISRKSILSTLFYLYTNISRIFFHRVICIESLSVSFN